MENHLNVSETKLSLKNVWSFIHSAIYQNITKNIKIYKVKFQFHTNLST